MGTRIPSVRDATWTGRTGVFAYTVNPDPFRPGQTSFSWPQEIFPMGTKRAFRSDGFVFSRLTVAACTLPAGNKAHEPDSCLPTAISRITAPAPMDSHLSPAVLPFDPAVCRGGAPYYKERGIWRLEPERMARRPNETSHGGRSIAPLEPRGRVFPPLVSTCFSIHSMNFRAPLGRTSIARVDATCALSCVCPDRCQYTMDICLGNSHLGEAMRFVLVERSDFWYTGGVLRSKDVRKDFI